MPEQRSSTSAARLRAIAAVPRLRRLVKDRNRLAAELARARERVARLEARERRLRKLVVPDRNLRYLFIVTYGRTGSTLLQGILNSVPGFLIRGENNGALYQLYQFHSLAAQGRRNRRRLVAERQVLSAWYGIDGYRDRNALRQIRQLMLATLIRPDPRSRVVGFKEIRYDQEDVAGYIEFMRRVFPGARFVFNTRDHGQVARSKWWAGTPDARAVLAKTESGLLRVAESLGDDAYLVRYDDYVDDPGRLRGLFAWLGEEFDEDRILEVMAQRHGY